MPILPENTKVMFAICVFLDERLTRRPYIGVGSPPSKINWLSEAKPSRL